ncbi:hypothetical protein CKAN_01549100 [Cinnamomum micranthum f. kanehirae]|uniref:Uncharacterized protein n=1 Tax=Cinnamomum micranthum f. kanehirae TaxID=337451 RepID=A0A3S3N1N6_9MAGN|nr:hypothetical protein CKAN_01549100 [Cinnamomum micranthum f. kanehirae]
MGLLHKFLATVAVVLLLRIHPHKACRVLEDKEEIWKQRGGGLVLESLQKGSDQSSGPSGCTNVPNNPGPNCPVKEMNFAGDASAHASAYPHQPFILVWSAMDDKSLMMMQNSPCVGLIRLR